MIDNQFVTPAAAIPVAAPVAQAFDFNVSGQVNRAAIAADNGEDLDVGFVDNTGNSSRPRFTGMANGMTVGFI